MSTFIERDLKPKTKATVPIDNFHWKRNTTVLSEISYAQYFAF